MNRLGNTLERIEKRAGEVVQALAECGSGGSRMSGVIRKVEKQLVRFGTRMGQVVASTDGAWASMLRLKNALLILTRPLMGSAIPALVASLHLLMGTAMSIMPAVAALFGMTAGGVRATAESLLQESYALKVTGTAAEKAGGSLADFDELNRLEGNGGGGFSLEAEGAVTGGLSFDLDTEGAKNGLDQVLVTIKLIGEALLSWKLAGSLEVLFSPGGISGLIGALLALVGAIGMLKMNWGDWQSGIDLGLLVGVQLLIQGLSTGLGGLTAAIGVVAAGLTLLATGILDVNTNGWNLQITLLGIAALITAGLGIPAMTETFIPALLLGISTVLLSLTTTFGTVGLLFSGLQITLEGFKEFVVNFFSGEISLAIQGLGVTFGGLQTIFGTVIEAVMTAILALLDWLLADPSERLRAVIDGIKELIELAFQGISEVISGVIDVIVVMVLGAFNTIKEIIFGISDGITEWCRGFSDGVMTAIKFIVDYLDDVVIGYITNLIQQLSGMLDGLRLMFSGVVEFLSGVFSGDWDKAWSGIVNIFKGFVNILISMAEGFVNSFIKGVNAVIEALNRINITVPEWVPAIGGKYFGFSLPKIAEFQIPRLATGAVIPPNREFMAVLGDQRYGNNIEAPEALIRKIVREEGGGAAVLPQLKEILATIREGKVMMVDGRVLARVAQEALVSAQRAGGAAVLVR